MSLLDDVLPAALLHGALLCGVMTAVIAGSLWHDPLIWLRSSPPDVQAAVGPPSQATLRRKRGWGVVTAAGLLGVFGHLVATVFALAPGDGFPALALYLSAWVAFQCFNLFDALVIDLGLVVLKPRWAFPPGTEHLPGFTSVRWHLVNFAKGLAGGFVFAAVVTAVALPAWWLSR